MFLLGLVFEVEVGFMFGIRVEMEVGLVFEAGIGCRIKLYSGQFWNGVVCCGNLFSRTCSLQKK